MQYIYDCGCPIRTNMTKEELLVEIYRPLKYCTAHIRHPHICSNLDKEYRRAIADTSSKKYRTKQLKEKGYSEEEITQKLQKGRKTKKAKYASVDLSGL